MKTLEANTISFAEPSLYLNRRLSLLEFQRRVLDQARDVRNPLLERIKFLAILGSNMDEFFMLRLPDIRKRAQSDGGEGLPPTEELAAARKMASELYTLASRCLNRDILPRLNKAGVHILDYADLSKQQKERAREYFEKTIYPLLIPLPLSHVHPFPHISNLYLNLAIVLRDRKGQEKLMRLQVPETLPRLFPLKRSSGATRKDGTIPHHHYFLWLEQIIAANLADVFPGMKVVAVHPFRIIRDASLQFDDIDNDDPLESIETLSVQRREFGEVVQVAVYEDMPFAIRELLAEILGAAPEDFYVKGNPLGLRNLWHLYTSVQRNDLKYPVYEPRVPKPVRKLSRSYDIFRAIQQQNILLHHPYDSFSPVVDFLRAAARDPSVLSIKQTLYRVGQNSPVMEALMDASERYKQVTALVELKATFDEESNIGWARLLERSGVHVIHGPPGLKTHCKVCLVVREEDGGLCRYVHLSTGNYNAVTSRIYEDIGFFTCDEAIGEDADRLFNYFAGYSKNLDYQKFLVAPFGLRQRLEALIRREIEHARRGSFAHLIFKVNSLVDHDMIALLYEASKAGVHIDLLVRGMCSLRPGISGMSENIHVTSILGRYLEHSRIFYFRNGGREQIYLGSADLMERNLNSRVELLFLLESPEHFEQILALLQDVYLRDNQLAYTLLPNGQYVRRQAGAGETPINVQDWLMRRKRKMKKSSQ